MTDGPRIRVTARVRTVLGPGSCYSPLVTDQTEGHEGCRQDVHSYGQRQGQPVTRSGCRTATHTVTIWVRFTAGVSWPVLWLVAYPGAQRHPPCQRHPPMAKLGLAMNRTGHDLGGNLPCASATYACNLKFSLSITCSHAPLFAAAHVYST